MWRLHALEKSTQKGNMNSMRNSAAHLRVMKDLNELSLPHTCSTEFPDPDDLLNFYVDIRPDEGYYCGGTFRFAFNIGQEYPHSAPKVKCINQIFHPNIDLDGNVCLNILREEWKPVLSINSIIYGLQHLLLEPNPEDALNKEAADLLRQDPSKFEKRVSYLLQNQPSSHSSKLVAKDNAELKIA